MLMRYCFHPQVPYSLYYNAVCRRAPTTLGLVNIINQKMICNNCSLSWLYLLFFTITIQFLVMHFYTKKFSTDWYFKLVLINVNIETRFFAREQLEKRGDKIKSLKHCCLLEIIKKFKRFMICALKSPQISPKIWMF